MSWITLNDHEGRRKLVDEERVNLIEATTLSDTKTKFVVASVKNQEEPGDENKENNRSTPEGF